MGNDDGNDDILAEIHLFDGIGGDRLADIMHKIILNTGILEEFQVTGEMQQARARTHTRR